MAKLNVLSISDVQSPLLYSARIRDRFHAVDLVLSCGDLPYFYLEYIISTLDMPLFFVRGNHDKRVEYGVAGPTTGPQGGIDLHQRVINHQGLLLAGVEGCVRYNLGPYQYSQAEMWEHVLRLAPFLLANRLRYGRYLDIFLTHAPPWASTTNPTGPTRGSRPSAGCSLPLNPNITSTGTSTSTGRTPPGLPPSAGRR